MKHQVEKSDISDPIPPKKKPYQPPILQDWGTLQDLTKATGFSGKKDGGRGIFSSRTR